MTGQNLAFSRENFTNHCKSLICKGAFFKMRRVSLVPARVRENVKGKTGICVKCKVLARPVLHLCLPGYVKTQFVLDAIYLLSLPSRALPFAISSFAFRHLELEARDLRNQ